MTLKQWRFLKTSFNECMFTFRNRYSSLTILFYLLNSYIKIKIRGIKSLGSFFNVRPPCRRAANKTRLKQVGTSPRFHAPFVRSPKQPKRSGSGGLQSAFGAKFPNNKCWIYKNRTCSYKAVSLYLFLHIV